jgi:UPF0755 protein
MADRTPEEREAARLDRERRRAGRTDGSGDGDLPPAPELAAVAPPPEFASVPGQAVDADHGSNGSTDEHDFDEDFTDEHDVEIPSGTRRISHGENVAATRARTQGKGRFRRPHRPRVRPRVRPGKGRKWVGRVVSLVALGLAAALIWFLVELFQPFHGSGHGEVTVTIPPHASSSKIADLLAQDGVISSTFFFELRATLAGERSDLRSGVYHLKRDMSYSDVLTALTKAPPAAKVTELTITPGKSRHEIDALLHSQHVGGSYLAETRHTSLLDLPAYGIRRAPPDLEGFLFPDTYQVVEPIKISALVKKQLTDFKKHFAGVNMDYARSKHLTPYDVLKIASLVEAEAATARSRPLVASVIYNRLADGMLLQLDSTTRFATGNYTKPLTDSELHSRSPYNTRTHLGLPPTPIDNPGMAAIQAAAHPAHTNYLFFFTRNCGQTVFASNYSQFLAQGSQNLGSHCPKG